jgi:hypothetical protein
MSKVPQMIQDKAERMLRFYKIKLGEGLSAEAAMEKVKYKFSPSAFELATLSASLAKH